MRPIFMSFFPEHLFGSQCPRSQHAALKEGRDAGCSPSSLSFRGPLVLGALLYFLPLEEKLSFLCCTILTYLCTMKCGCRKSRCYKIYVVQVESSLRRQGSSRLESADNPGKPSQAKEHKHLGRVRIPPPNLRRTTSAACLACATSNLFTSHPLFTVVISSSSPPDGGSVREDGGQRPLRPDGRSRPITAATIRTTSL